MRVAQWVTVGLGAALAAGLAGCGGGSAVVEARGTVEVCVGTGVGREDGWTVEVVQDGEVVGAGSVTSASAQPAVPSGVSVPVFEGPFEVRFDDGTVIGTGELDGGSLSFDVGEGCPPPS